MEDDFSGPSDSSEAPFFMNYAGNDYVLTATGDDSSNVDQQSPVSTPGISRILAKSIFPPPLPHKNVRIFKFIAFSHYRIVGNSLVRFLFGKFGIDCRIKNSPIELNACVPVRYVGHFCCIIIHFSSFSCCRPPPKVRVEQHQAHRKTLPPIKQRTSQWTRHNHQNHHPPIRKRDLCTPRPSITLYDKK
jgi:hypothetical protein